MHTYLGSRWKVKPQRLIEFITRTATHFTNCFITSPELEEEKRTSVGEGWLGIRNDNKWVWSNA